MRSYISDYNIDEDIASASSVLECEIKGLTSLTSILDQKFSKAIDIIFNLTGKVIVSGMGKSGHIANKIAATLASIGTAAFFVHPGEASHGDLGMITKEDAVILLSNSGETRELNDIIIYCKRFAIPLIAIVRNPNSVLAEAANVALILPPVPEAWVIDAPTTSTTMMLALGDAIAVVLAKRKGFSSDDFKIFHPGGKIGASFTKVGAIMHKDDKIPIVSEQCLMSEALITMTEKSLGCLAVIGNQGELAGMITDGDLRRHMSPQLLSCKANEVMTPNPITISPNILVAEALNIMSEKAISNLLVIEDKSVIGVLALKDCLRIGAK